MRDDIILQTLRERGGKLWGYDWFELAIAKEPWPRSYIACVFHVLWARTVYAFLRQVNALVRSGQVTKGPVEIRYVLGWPLRHHYYSLRTKG